MRLAVRQGGKAKPHRRALDFLRGYASGRGAALAHPEKDLPGEAQPFRTSGGRAALSSEVHVIVNAATSRDVVGPQPWD
jgi:hypothetical protein